MSTHEDTQIGLRFEGVRKSYGNTLVIPDLTFDVTKGEILSLLGPSGCGKTTTLNIIAGFTPVNAGTVELDGIDITHRPPNKRDTAIVFQNYALFPHMTVAKNVGYGLKARKRDAKEIKDRSSSVLEMMGISHLADRYPSELSGGQQQRVSLARALAVRPSLLLLDEPLSNLDTKLRAEIRLEIRRLQQELSQTAVFVTHDQEEALVMSDHIAVLKEGVVEQFGTPRQVWEHPTTAYVADFMGVENILPVSGGTNSYTVTDAVTIGGVPVNADNIEHLGFRPTAARVKIDQSELHDEELCLSARVLSSSYVGAAQRLVCVAEGSGGHVVNVDESQVAESFAVGDKVFVVVPRDSLLPLEGSLVLKDSAPAGRRGPTEGEEQ